MTNDLKDRTVIQAFYDLEQMTGIQLLALELLYPEMKPRIERQLMFAKRNGMICDYCQTLNDDIGYEFDVEHVESECVRKENDAERQWVAQYSDIPDGYAEP